MNVELTQDGRKKLFNWDNVIAAGHPRYNNNPEKTELWCVGNVVWHVDEIYEEMKKIIVATTETCGGVKII